MGAVSKNDICGIESKSMAEVVMVVLTDMLCVVVELHVSAWFVVLDQLQFCATLTDSLAVKIFFSVSPTSNPTVRVVEPTMITAWHA